jgi:hypothetical protein
LTSSSRCAVFFCSCSEFNTIIFFFFLFSGDSFQESDKYAIQARIDSVWGEDYILVPSSFYCPAEVSIAEQIEDCHRVAAMGRSAAMARGGGNRERWVSAAGLNAGLHGN